MRIVSTTVLVAAALLASSCGSDKSPEKIRSDEKQPAAAGEGAMCAEHGVLEAVCTKCNPKLIAVFKAKGDWCEEHGFPESFCPICHPERGGKPAGDVKNDGAPADGTKVRFRTKEAAKQAGIATVAAQGRAGGARLQVVATVHYDATRHAEVNARAPGVVDKLHVDVGTSVILGQPLALVQSATVGADRSKVKAAAARVAAAEASYERERALGEKGIAPEKDVLAARRELEEARAELAGARAALGMVGAGEGGAGGYTLRAPIAGTVTRRHATIGHMVGTDEVLFEIVDTSSMWVEVDIPEDQLAAVTLGQKVTVVLDSMPDREWRGEVKYIAPEVEEKTRTARARVAVDNPEKLMRANMYGKAFIELAAARPTVMVPREAVQRAGAATLVFVRLNEDVFEARRVKVGLSEGDVVELREGVKSGELVATRGSFLLKTETLKGSIGAGCCDVEK